MVPEINSALVINSQQNGLGVIRSIAASRFDLAIYASDHESRLPSFSSKYLQGNFVLPQVYDEQFIPKMIETGSALQNRHGGLALLCPVSDEFVLVFSKNWDKLAPYFFPMFTTNEQILHSCVDKNAIYTLAKSVEVPFPNSASSLAAFIDEGLSFPAVIKPLLRRSPTAIKKGVFRIAFCDSQEQAREPAGFLERVDEPYVIQEYIPGNDDELYTAGIASWEGETLATYSGKKLRQYPPSTGVAALALSTYEPRVVDYGRRLLEAAGYSGIAQVEFKKSGDNFYLMEINPRPWMWNSLSTASGINLVEAFIEKVSTGVSAKKIPEASQQRNGGLWMAVLHDLEHNVIRHRNIGVFSWLNDLRRSQCKAFWKLSDPIPGLKNSIFFLSKKFKSVVRKTKKTK